MNTLPEIREEFGDIRFELGCAFWDYQYRSDASDLAERVMRLIEVMMQLCKVLEQPQPTGEEK